MPAYIVRTIEELRLVGIFVARSPSDLFAVVDESLNPGDCEYFKLNNDEGLFLDGQFTAETEDGSISKLGEEMIVGLRAVPESDASAPEMSEQLGYRLSRGRSWTAFTVQHFRDVFGFVPSQAETVSP